MGQSCSTSTPAAPEPPPEPQNDSVVQQELDHDLDKILVAHVPSPARSPVAKRNHGVEHYRAFKLTVRPTAGMPLQLVVRPFETIDQVKRRLFTEHRRARPENQQLTTRDGQGLWIELDDPGSTIAQYGIARGDMLRLVENRSEQYESRLRKLESLDEEKKEKMDRLAQLVRAAEASPTVSRSKDGSRACVLGHDDTFSMEHLEEEVAASRQY